MEDQNRNIIIIDDDKQIWQAYKNVLNYSDITEGSAGKKLSALLDDIPSDKTNDQPTFDLFFASQGQDGFGMVQERIEKRNHFSVAFIDIRMPPGWDGMKTATKIRQIDPNIEIVIVTAYADRSREEIVKNVGTPAKLLFLRKPFDPEELFQLALSLSEKWQLARREEKAQAALTKSEARFRSLVETTSDFVWEANYDGRFTYCSPICKDIYGFIPAEMLGKTLAELVMSEEAALRHQQLLKQSLNNFSGCEVNECKCKNKDGTDVFIESSMIPIVDDNGKISGFRGIDRDITERVKMLAKKKRLEEQYRQAQKMEAIGTLAGGIAHDLNNVLTPVIGYTELCRLKCGPNSPLINDLDIIEQSAQKAASLIRQILAFSRKQMLTPKVCDLNTIIHDFMKMLSRIIREDIELKLNLRDNLWSVHIDRGQFEQVLVNLVINASDAIRDRGNDNGRIIITTDNLSISAEKELIDVNKVAFSGNFILLAVSDNGSGIDQPTFERIFEPFFTTKEVGQGTGLGLATVYGVTHQHDGHIIAKTGINKGTTFSVYIPRTEKQLKKDSRVPNSALSGGDEVILVAEDDYAVRGLTVSFFKSLGYKVLSAENGDEALQIFKEANANIDILVTDVVMPAQGGADLATAMRKEKPNLPLIFISGYPRDMAPTKMLKMPFTAFVQKPFKTKALAVKVREMLDEQQK